MPLLSLIEQVISLSIINRNGEIVRLLLVKLISRFLYIYEHYMHIFVIKNLTIKTRYDTLIMYFMPFHFL